MSRKSALEIWPFLSASKIAADLSSFLFQNALSLSFDVSIAAVDTEIRDKDQRRVSLINCFRVRWSLKYIIVAPWDP